MRVGEDHALSSELIRMRRGDFARRRRETVNVSVAEVIAHDEDNVGFLSSVERCAKSDKSKNREEAELDEGFHAAILCLHMRKRFRIITSACHRQVNDDTSRGFLDERGDLFKLS